jgi:hypothetical protein
MKNIILLISFLCLVSFQKVETTVYICESSNASKYHYSEACRGLNACKHKIIATTQTKAKSMGLTLCKWDK